MAWIRIQPDKDTSISNYDPPSVGTQSTEQANAGASEILNLFTYSDPLSTGSILTYFNIKKIPQVAIDNGASFFIKLFDAQHQETVPAECSVIVAEVSQPWVEGVGLDQDYYTDVGVANWLSASTTSTWVVPGGSGSGPHDLRNVHGWPLPLPLFTDLTSTFYLQSGNEDIFVDVTLQVADWIFNDGSNGASGTANNGFLIYLDPLFPGTKYIKKLHSRQSHFPTKRPYLEAQWSDWTGSLSTFNSVLVTSGDYSGTVWPALAPFTGLVASGSATLITQFSSDVDPTSSITTVLYDAKSVYAASETAHLRLQTQRKDWNPSTVATASAATPSVVLTKAYYRILNEGTGEEIVPFGSSSSEATRMSFNDAGNYFDVNMGSLPVNTLMRLEMIYQVNGIWKLITDTKPLFRVVQE
jgi:hypothetical protein